MLLEVVPSPGMYAPTSIWLVSRTRATLRSAEFGFFGVVVYTRVQTPASAQRLGGQVSSPWSGGLATLPHELVHGRHAVTIPSLSEVSLDGFQTQQRSAGQAQAEPRGMLAGADSGRRQGL